MGKNKPFVPHHIDTTPDELSGNQGIGRYILLPGSNGRAKHIAEHFHDHTIKSHPRGHDLHLGTLSYHQQTIDVAVIASGMGCPSMEIILHELFHLGGKRFLRVGTAGSLQPDTVAVGDVVNAHASVRDEETTTRYVPIEFPAVASYECIAAIAQAAKQLGISKQTHTGIIHCKSSLYAREFGFGPQGESNLAYMDLLRRSGVMATEMETAALFIQSRLYDYQLSQQGEGPVHRVLCGAILGIISIPPTYFATAAEEKAIASTISQLAVESVKILAISERQD